MNLIPERWANELQTDCEGPVGRMARELANEFDRQAARAVTADLADLPRLWPGPTLGGVSGDALAGGRAKRLYGTPDLNVWAMPGVAGSLEP